MAEKTDGTEKIKGLADYCKERIGRFESDRNEIVLSSLSGELKNELIALLTVRISELEKLLEGALFLLEKTSP